METREKPVRLHERRPRGRSVKALEHQMPWISLRNLYAPVEILSADAIEAIHEASLTILEEIGVGVLLPEAIELCRKAGARVEPGSERVRFDRHFIEAALATTRPSFEMTARNPVRNRIMGERVVNYCTVGGPPNCSDIERGRRSGTFADFCDFLRLAQSFNAIHILAGYAVEPMDIPVPVRHLDATMAILSLSDKIPFLFSHSAQRIADCLEMVRIAHGLSPDEVEKHHFVYTVINTNSPLQLDRPMLEGIINMARANQPVVVTPFTLAGAMAPVTIIGALAQQNAEALAGIAIGQLARPGAPVVYGGFTTNVDMRTGAPAFGTPEYAKAALISGQLARRYHLPFRSSNINASNAPDVQSAYEGMMSTWSAVMGGVNLLIHGAGWLEGGLCASFEKFVIDIEILQMFASFLQPEVVDARSLALDAIAEVGPGGHFFGAAHTLERYETAFYRPLISDWRNFESWQEGGSIDATRRANELYKKVLAEYEEPRLDAAIAEELAAFVARRKSEGGAPLT